MRFITYILKVTLLFSIVSSFASCKGQNKKLAEQKTTQTIAVIIGDTVLSIGKNIDCILQDKEGNYWFASNGDGVYCFNGKILTHITKKHGLCSDYVWNIQQDASGHLWFTTRDGFCSYNKGVFIDCTDIIKNAPYGKLEYTKGGLFFDHLNGMCFYNGNSFTNFVIHPSNYSPSPSDMNRPYSIYSTLVDNVGNVWFGTQSKGVCSYDGKTFIYITDKNLAGPAVRTLFQDKKGNMWFGNNGGGLYCYNGNTLTNITEEKGLGNAAFLKGYFNDKPGSLARVWTINDDKEGNIWIGTIDAGVWKFDGTNLTNYTIKDGLTGNAIWKIYKDNAGELWFVIDGESICKFNGAKFITYNFQ